MMLTRLLGPRLVSSAGDSCSRVKIREGTKYVGTACCSKARYHVLDGQFFTECDEHGRFVTFDYGETRKLP